MTDRDIMQQALEALVLLTQAPTETALDYADNAIDALRERLAQPEQEPMLTVDALRVEFERPYKGHLGSTRLSHGGYLSPTIDKEWQQFVSRYTAPQRKPLTDGLGIKVKRELFRFHSKQEWVNKAQSWYANCGVRRGYYITIDAAGHVMHIGRCFKDATYPVTCYELQTNWLDEPAAHGIKGEA